MPTLTEHSITLHLPELRQVVSAEMEVFYNPIMASNRNISILLLNTISNTKLNLADPLAGSGIRSLRFLKELQKGKLKTLHTNDHKDNFKTVFGKALKLNHLRPKNLFLHQEDASLFLLHGTGFDYIDIDPFGSPNPFLAAAITRISRNGILAVTCTDTAALTGTYPAATQRKYWAKSMKNYLMHELGLRILIQKVQLQGVQFDKALTPILAYFKDHYYRVYFRNDKGKQNCDQLLKQHQYFLFCSKCLRFHTSIHNSGKCRCGAGMEYAGPLWAGAIIEHALIQKMAHNNYFPEEQKFLELLAAESKMPLVGFYDLHAWARKHHREAPSFDDVFRWIPGIRTHFSPTGFKTTLAQETVFQRLTTLG